MRLSHTLRTECVAAEIEFGDKEAALRGIARLAKKCSVVEQVSEDAILKGLRDREALGSTAFGGGVAIPHCRLRDVPDFVVGVATVPKGVDFDAADGKKVNVLVFMVGPSRETTEHLRILSAISLALNAPGALEELLAAGTPEELLESFLRHSREDIDLQGHTNRRLIHIFMQEEEMFQKLLSALESVESVLLNVIEGKNSGEYLAKMPLFAGIFGEGHLTFSRIIVVIVDKAMTNETIRIIESVTGHLDDCHRALVTVQDVFYAAGALEV